MENASNALIIAAGVLIGVLILTLAVTLVTMLGGYISDTQKSVDEDRLIQFNEQFLKYNGKTNLTIQDVVTARNRALEENQTFDDYNPATMRATINNNYIDVYFNGNIILDKEKYPSNKLLNDALVANKTDNIKCTVTLSPDTGRVYKLEFQYN